MSKTISEGSTSVPITIDPRDQYGNPTSHESDVFQYFWADNEETAKTLSTDTEIEKFSEGTSLLHVTLNGVDIAGSPFAVSSEKELLKMPGLATIALIVAIVIGGGQLLFMIIVMFALRDKIFIKRQSVVNLLFALYSGVDWVFDVYFVSKAFERGYSTHGSVGGG